MQVSSKNIIFLIEIASVIFLITPVFLIAYVALYNRRKKRHVEEKERMRQVYETEILKAQMEVQEQTLQSVAYNLHDNVGQLLSLTIATLNSINPDDRGKLPVKISSAEELTRRSLKELRALSRVLQGQELLEKGLAHAIDSELEWLRKSERYTIELVDHYVVSATGQHDKEIILFRLFQEILNNILRHSGATAIRVSLEQAAGELTLCIEDNGEGFDVAGAMKAKKGLGLHNIQRRAAMINGRAVFDSVSGRGTAVTIIVPY